MGWLRSVHLEDRPTVGAETRGRAASFEDFSALERDQLFGVLVLVTGVCHETEDLAQEAPRSDIYLVRADGSGLELAIPGGRTPTGSPTAR